MKLSKDYYTNYYGHPIQDLDNLVDHCYGMNKVYLVGDSTLDNKKWVSTLRAPPVNGYQGLVEEMVPDVNYFFNYYLEGYNLPYISLNFAIEEDCIHDKMSNGSVRSKLNSKESMVKNSLTHKDILIISIGGNDLSLKSNFELKLKLFEVFMKTTPEVIRKDIEIILPQLVQLFKVEYKNYIEELVSKTKPKMIFLCAPYYPCKIKQESWASTVLSMVGYDNNPEKSHALLQGVYEKMIREINIEGAKIFHIPFYEILDWKDEKDYVARVEPSTEGGRKIAEHICGIIYEELNA